SRQLSERLRPTPKMDPTMRLRRQFLWRKRNVPSEGDSGTRVSSGDAAVSRTSCSHAGRFGVTGADPRQLNHNPSSKTNPGSGRFRPVNNPSGATSSRAQQLKLSGARASSHRRSNFSRLDARRWKHLRTTGSERQLAGNQTTPARPRTG